MIDLVSTTQQNIVEHIEWMTSCDRDHIIIRWDLDRKTKIDASLHTTFSFYKSNYFQMREHMSKFKCQDELNIKRVEQMWYVFEQILDIVVKAFVPLINISRHRKLMWLDHKCIRAVQFF